MVNRCPNCGGLLNYDIESGKLKCESCDSLLSAEEYADNTAAKEDYEALKYSVNVFTCPNCGGSISSNEAEAVEYCLYCGSFVSLTSQVEKVKKPNFILPFKTTKEECVKSYSKMIRKKIYAPKAFRNEKFIDTFKGIYIPYWTYSYDFGPNVTLDGVTKKREGDYVYEHHYDIECQVDGHLDGVTFDASSSFDDDISSRILPFNSRELKPFNNSYMFGFFADTADIDSNLYRNDAKKTARDEIWDEVTKDERISSKNPRRPESDGKFDEMFGLKGSSNLSMLPVWFLTWRNKDRVAYSVVNGNTGAIYSEVPVDVKRYLLFSLLFAIPIFLLFNCLFTFTAKAMLITSVILSLFMMILYSLQLDRIVRKRLHVDDKGYINKHKESKEDAEKVTDNLVVEFVKAGLEMILAVGFGGILLIAAIALSFPVLAIIAGIASVLFVIIYSIVRIGKSGKILKDKTVILDILGSVFSLALSALLLIVNPAGDEFYYVAAMLCIGGVGLSAIFTMKRYNELVTRPLPHFFNRKAGGEE